jgi:putative ABC transport system permease protein
LSFPRRTLPFTTAARIAWRDLRATPAKFLFVVLAVAVGVGAITGVRGFSQAFRAALLSQARTLMSADLTVRLREYPAPDQMTALDEPLRSRGAYRTWVTELISMASTAASPIPQMVALKAVDPQVYPFYGAITVNPSMDLKDALRPDSVVVSDDLPARLKSEIGGMLRIGGQEFRIAATIVREPDRLAGSANPGMRVLITRAGLDRAGLLRPGARSVNRFLYKLPTAKVPATKEYFRQALPEAQVLDYRETDPAVTRGLDNATTFLSLVSLIALIVGALGVAMAMFTHIEQRMDSIAVLKCLGARSTQVLQIYAMETLGLGIAGGLLGIVVGAGVERAFPMLLARLLTLEADLSWHWTLLAEALGVGVLSTLLFTLPPLLGVRRIRPNRILRRAMDEGQPTMRERIAQGAPSFTAAALLVAGLDLIAVWLSQSWRAGSYFLGGLIASLVTLAAVAWLLLMGLRRLVRAFPLLPPALRHGIANLYRPGNQSQAVLVALGIGVMFTMTTYLIQREVVDEISSRWPASRPNVFLLDVTPAQKPALTRLVESQPGVQGKILLAPSLPIRVQSVNGTPIEDLPRSDRRRRFAFNVPSTWTDTLPPNTRVLEGGWWNRGVAEPRVSLSETEARFLRIHPGDTIEFRAAGKVMRARVAAVHRIETNTMGSGMFGFVFSESTFAALPAIYYGGVRVDPPAVGKLQQALYTRFPTVTVINFADTMRLVQDIVDQVAVVIRFLAGFAILAGVVILAASVAGTRFRRIREVVILKTLGGTRRRVAAIFSVEFLILGTVAGLIGAVLAWAFTNILWQRFFQGDSVPFHPGASLIAVGATALIANVAGWLASFRILGEKPLEVLREE